MTRSPTVKQSTRSTQRTIRQIFRRLDYQALGPVYCDEGGDEFWKAKRGLCQRLGIKLNEVIRPCLKQCGTSLYVGAGVAELPAMAMESLDLRRSIIACNLRRKEVFALNRACSGLPFRFEHRDAGSVRTTFDHLWIVSVLNDPERFPDVSAVSYGRANPVTLNAAKFLSQRVAVKRLVDHCLAKLTLPGLVTTSVEEVVWIAEWCHRHAVPYLVGRKSYPSPTVGDPICLVSLGSRFVGSEDLDHRLKMGRESSHYKYYPAMKSRPRHSNGNAWKSDPEPWAYLFGAGQVLTGVLDIIGGGFFDPG